MTTSLTSEEQAQIQQTIEMFEVIALTQPDDYQSYDILKEAYMKLGRMEDASATSRKLIQAYQKMGLYSNALLEAEGILQFEPNAPDLLQIVTELNALMAQSAPRTTTSEDGIHTESDENLRRNLIATNTTAKSKVSPQKVVTSDNLKTDDGNEQFAKYMEHHGLVDSQLLQNALNSTREKNKNLSGQALATSLLDELSKAEDPNVDIDSILSNLIAATQFAYMPVEYYDVDRQFVRLLPEHLTLGRLMLPFDLVGRTLMVATCNPLDGPGKEAVQNQVDYTIQWYIAKPSAIVKVLRDVYRLDSRD